MLIRLATQVIRRHYRRYKALAARARFGVVQNRRQGNKRSDTQDQEEQSELYAELEV